MRILIAEEALQDGEGHWPSYIGGLAREFREAGDSVDVLVHAKAVPSVVESVNGIPWFERNCWKDSASQGGLGGIKHNLYFEKRLGAWLYKAENPYDWVCALTMRLQHLLAFARLCRRSSIGPSTRFLLLFVQGFGQYIENGPTEFPTNGSTLLARICFKLMAKAVREGRVVLAAETKGMKDELERFTGLPVSLFPHPVPAPNSETEPVLTDQSIVMTCPGVARHEKGSDLLHGAIQLALKDPVFDNVRFVMQWPHAFNLPDGTEMSPHPSLLEHERVIFENATLDAAGYEQLLLKSSAILLPYRRASYHNRVSRVAIEAASRGLPLIYMSGTWSSEIAELVRTGIPIEGESIDAVYDAMKRALEQITVLRKQAADQRESVITFHSARTFHQLMAERTA